MVQVFLSYSHDDQTHTGNVHDLADRLQREGGVKVVLDRDAGPGGPDEGWPAWSERQVREADRVLIACSEVYARRYEGNDGDSDRGRGTVIEARAIQQFLYDSKGQNARFRVVLFDPAHEEHIPHQLRGYHHFLPNDHTSYQRCVTWLKSGVKDIDAPLPTGPVWPPPDLAFKLPLADRRSHFDAVRAALSGQSSNRIFLFEGEGASGKTLFLNELSAYAQRVGIPWTRFDFKGAPALDEFYEAVVFDLRGELVPETKAARSKASLRELVNDLERLTTPVLFLFDTFEKASEDTGSWLSSKFLPRIRALSAVVVVVGGQSVPDRTQHPWKSLAEFHRLDAIQSAEDWKEYVDRVHPGNLELDQIKLLTEAAEGQPGTLRALIDTLAKRRSRQ